MTDYEMVDAFNGLWSLVWIIFTVYVTVTFAFLVVGYQVASKLSRSMAALAVTLYSLVAFWCMFAIERFATNGLRLGTEIKRAVLENESSLSWTTMASDPDSTLVSFLILSWVVLITTYCGSVFFFFFQRTHGIERV